MLEMCGLFVRRGLSLSGSQLRSLLTSTTSFIRSHGQDEARTAKNLGRLIALKSEEDAYLPGQLFVHKLFPYRGIVLCSFSCPIEERPSDPQAEESAIIRSTGKYYQVLIHNHDWQSMGFPVDMTAYLEDMGNTLSEKTLTVIFGMDCVPHNELIPYQSKDPQPIAHELFRSLFHSSPDKHGEMWFSIKKEPSYLIPHHSSYILSQLAPHSVNRQTTDGIMVTVITFYLGLNTVCGQQKHWWRYVIRLQNMSENVVILRAREMKVYSLSNMQQQKVPYTAGKTPRLAPEQPAFQYSGTVGVAVDRGSYAWGNFTVERENDRTSFLAKVPTFKLEYCSNTPPEETKTECN